MDTRRLIPLAGLVGACSPYAGDWELASVSSGEGAQVYLVSGSSGDLSIKGKKAELDLNLAGYLQFSGEGEVDDNGDGAFDLEISGALNYYGLPAPASVDAACAADGDELACTASLSISDGAGGGYAIPLLVAFERG